MSDHTYKIFVLEMESLMLQYEEAVGNHDMQLMGHIWHQMKEKLHAMGEIEGLEVFL